MEPSDQQPAQQNQQKGGFGWVNQREKLIGSVILIFIAILAIAFHQKLAVFAVQPVRQQGSELENRGQGFWKCQLRFVF